MLFNHSASNSMKSLLIICLRSAKETSKQCSGVTLISLFFMIKLFKVIHSVERKILNFFFNLFIQQMKSLANVKPKKNSLP